MAACAVFLALALSAAPPSPPSAPSSGEQIAQARKPDLRPRLIIEGATELPRLMQGDPAFSSQAQALARRQTQAWIAGGLGIAASLGFAFASVSSMGSDPRSGQPPDGAAYALAGLASLAVGGLVAIALVPKRGEVVDLVNGWNLAHPDQPLEVQPVFVVPVASSESAFPAPPSPPPDVGPRLISPAGGGPPVMAIPVGGGLYVPLDGGPTTTGAPLN